MKIIISHDVDHLFLHEHVSDTYLLGLAYRSFKAITLGGINLRQFRKRFSYRIHRLPELIDFNQKHDIKSSFFFAMGKGLNLSYNKKQVTPLIHFVQEAGMEVGLHGMAFDDIKLMEQERQAMSHILNQSEFGIRNHYLRMSPHTKKYMNELGYLYDSTDYQLTHPTKEGLMSEIPISLMDAGFISQIKGDLQEIQQKTISILEEALKLELPYFVINFHDQFFSEGYPNHFNWYKWLIQHLKDQNFEFTTFKAATKAITTK